MTLYLVRHAEAHPGEPDAERPLTDKGRKASRRIGDALDAMSIHEAAVLHSGLVRARETAEIIARCSGVDEVRAVEGMEPDADPAIWAERLRAERRDLVIVGHMPHLELLLARLLDLPRAPVRFRKTTVVCLERPDAGGDWTIEWVIHPKLVKALG